MKHYLTIISILLFLVSTANASAPNNAHPQVLLETTKGNIRITLNPDKAPKTVENFLTYVREGHYNGTIFHRVIKGFMIQGGGLTPDMQAKQTHSPVINEADNQLKNKTGTIAMARTMMPHSATSQFFINVNDNYNLDHTAKNSRGWGYCVFGNVTEGMDVVQTIENVQTTSRAGHRDVPSEPIVIKKAEIIKPKTE